MNKDIKTLLHFPREYFDGNAATYRYGLDDFILQREKDLKDTFGRFVFSEKTDTELQVLAIGSADGTRDIPIIDTLVSKFSSMKYIVVDPSAKSVQKFQDLVKSKQELGLWKRADFEFHPTSVEEYLREAEVGKAPDGYDIIHLQHSAYYLADPDNIFVELHGKLNAGGMLFTMLGVGAWEEINRRIANIIPEPLFPGSAALRELLQRCIPDVKIQTRYRKRSFKANELFKEESKDGNILLDFIFYIYNFRKSAPPEVVSDLMEFLRECCYDINGDLYFPADDEDIVVIKAL
ncbi:histamine N-methyltransferase-like [Ptychodera flava]|uniref:histamine N-methyltransferase-like n=1 Tax=Ptychodera flava TaxID=63121 RepID=UPI003969CC63